MIIFCGEIHEVCVIAFFLCEMILPCYLGCSYL